MTLAKTKEISINKKDVIWSYIAQFLSIGAGAITLPFILKKLSAEEIGLNYILLTVGSVIALIDLGFAPQFARNFTYIFSGTQELQKEGIGYKGDDINYELLGYLLKTARYIYATLAGIALILLLLIGTPYIYKTTQGFTAIPNALSIWVIYSFGVLFQIFYTYYFSMLLGAGKIREQKLALIGNKILYMSISIGGLYLGLGLMSVALAQLISPFFGRILSYSYFYTPDLRFRLSLFKFNDKKRIVDVFRTLWFNAKRTAIMSIGAYAVLRFSMFIAGLYLSLDEFGSFGLMVQLVGIIATVSCTLMQISQPRFASLRAADNYKALLHQYSIAYDIFIALFFLGSIILIIFGNSVLSMIKSNTILPDQTILIVYTIIMFLEFNHSNFAILIVSANKIPFAPASITTGIFVCIGIFIVVKFTSLGILGIVAVQGICQAAYQNWKWPQMALSQMNVTYSEIITAAFKRL